MGSFFAKDVVEELTVKVRIVMRDANEGTHWVDNRPDCKWCDRSEDGDDNDEGKALILELSRDKQGVVMPWPIDAKPAGSKEEAESKRAVNGVLNNGVLTWSTVHKLLAGFLKREIYRDGNMDARYKILRLRGTKPDGEHVTYDPFAIGANYANPKDVCPAADIRPGTLHAVGQVEDTRVAWMDVSWLKEEGAARRRKAKSAKVAVAGRTWMEAGKAKTDWGP